MTEARTDKPAVLVAGGAGFIGAQTCKALSRAGYLPVTLDNLSKGYAPQVKWGPLHEGDLRDAELVKSLVRQYDIKGALHFAAFIEVGESVRSPVKYWDNNVSAANAFAAALIEAGVEAFLFSSTAAVYGTPEYSPIPESHTRRRSTRTAGPSWCSSGRWRTSAPPIRFVGRRCATSTPRARTWTARSAKATSRKAT
jgi:UDP-glucose 4-epimerase